MRIRFHDTIKKDEQYPNEDAYDFWPRELDFVKRVALSDGASQSYASRKLANLLVEHFVTFSGNINLRDNLDLWLEGVLQAYNDACGDPRDWNWRQLALFERGSFASLLGLVFEKKGERQLVKIWGVGDTCAILLNNGKFCAAWPYKSSDQFQQRPRLISTIPSHNAFLRSRDFLPLHFIQLPITTKTIILCMTDALAAWALRCAEEKAPEWERLCNLSKPEEFEALVKDARENGQMRVDDTTLLVIDFESGANENVSKS
jgi:hypothetical protein